MAKNLKDKHKGFNIYQHAFFCDGEKFHRFPNAMHAQYGYQLLGNIAKRFTSKMNKYFGANSKYFSFCKSPAAMRALQVTFVPQLIASGLCRQGKMPQFIFYKANALNTKETRKTKTKKTRSNKGGSFTLITEFDTELTHFLLNEFSLDRKTLESVKYTREIQEAATYFMVDHVERKTLSRKPK